MDDKDKVLKDYIAYKSISVCERKLKDLKFIINQFIAFDSAPLKDYSEKILINYINSLATRYANETLNYIKANTKNFIKWFFVDWSSRYRNLDRICKSIKSEPTYTAEEMISEKDFEALIAEEKSIFWKAYFTTLFYGCCRPSELFLLKWKDLDYSDKDGGIFFSIYSKKNKKAFLKYLPTEAAYYLKQLQNNNSEYCFINPADNKLLNRRQPYYEISKISKKALGKKIDLYTLRHSIATINYNKDDIKDDIIATQMGHSKSMKGKYVHNDKNKLKANAKRIYIGELPQEKKHELEIAVEALLADRDFKSLEISNLKHAVEMLQAQIEGKVIVKKSIAAR